MPDPYRVDIDHTYLRFNPSYKSFHTKIREDIPAFMEYDEDSIAHQTRIFAWIVCMFDMNTPLRREIKDFYKRKVYAGSITGLKPDRVSGKYKEYLEKIFTGIDPKVNVLIVKYIASFASPEYVQLMGTQALQHNIMEKIISGDTSKDNQIILDNTTKTISSLTNFLYGSGERDEVYEARRALYKQVAYDLSDMRPESISRAIDVDGGLPEEWNPYGDGYLPGDIKFASDDDTIAEEDEV